MYHVRNSFAILLACVCATAASAADEKADTEYAKEGKGFTIKYPSKWKKTESDGVVHFQSPEGAYVDVVTQDMPQAFDFQSFVKLEVKGLKKKADFKEIENGSASIAGHNAKKYVCSYSDKIGDSDKTIETQISMYYLFKGKKTSGYTIYRITCVCKAGDGDKYSRLFDDVAATFEFEK